MTVTGCASDPWLGDNRSVASSIAAKHGFQADFVDAGYFVLAAYHRGFTAPDDELVVYIEGDGHAWASRYRLSPDPTPWNPVSLRLAAADPAAKVLYLGRPCQFTVDVDRRGCQPEYWSRWRFADEVISSINNAIDWAKGAAGAARVALIGYSGGGAVAALVAARRDDVSRLVTVAGNLDHVLWTTQHGITAMSGSLNAADFAPGIQTIPQVHFVGAKDDVVPPSVAESYVARMTDRSHTRVVVVPDFNHHCCWTQDWHQLIRQYLPYQADANAAS